MSTINEKLSFFDSFVRNSSLSKDGVNLNIWCPWCRHENKNKLKLAIHLEKGIYHCWICDKKGSNVEWLVKKLNPSKLEECKKHFKSKNTTSVLDFLSGTAEEEVDLSVSLPDGFVLLANNFSSIELDVRAVFSYALKRGISKHKLWFLRAGAALDSNFRRHLILPSFDANGNLNFYTARNIDADSNFAFKYKNASIPKKYIVFNEVNIDWNRELSIVEGPLDLLKTNDNATCLLGSSLTEDMLLFQRIVENKTPVVLALDSDVYNKTMRIANLLNSYNIDVRIADTRGFEDVGDMGSQDFLKIKDEADTFGRNDLLLNKIKML